MSFRLKNVSATYQRLVSKIFLDLLGKKIKVYIDDMLVKYLRVEHHISHFQQSFEILKMYNMKPNLTKYVLLYFREVLRVCGYPAGYISQFRPNSLSH